MANREPGGKGEQSLKHLLELTTDALIAFAAACLEAGAHLVQAGDSLASLDMISPVSYRKWAWPAERRFFGAINPLAERRGTATLLHICGNMTAVLESLADTGAHILELDHKVSLKVASERVVGDHGLMEVEETVNVAAIVHGRAKRRGLRHGADYLLFLDSTLARLWALRARAEGQLDDLIDDPVLQRAGTRITTTLAREYRIPWPDRRYGDVIW